MVLSAKNEDMRKREHFQKLYSQTKVCLDKMDETALSVLSKHFGNCDVKDAIVDKQNRLKQQQYFVLVAGMWNTILVFLLSYLSLFHYSTYFYKHFIFLYFLFVLTPSHFQFAIDR